MKKYEHLISYRNGEHQGFVSVVNFSERMSELKARVALGLFDAVNLRIKIDSITSVEIGSDEGGR